MKILKVIGTVVLLGIGVALLAVGAMYCGAPDACTWME